MSVLYARATDTIRRHGSSYTIPASSRHGSALGFVMSRWGLLLLVVLFFIAIQVIIQAILYLWNKFRCVLAEEYLTNSAASTDSPYDTWPYRDDIGPDIPTTNADARVIQQRRSDDPYVAGVTSLMSLADDPDRETYRPAPTPVTNEEEVRRLISQLQAIMREPDDSDIDDETDVGTKRARLDVVQNRIARLVLADPRYAIGPTVLGPPPAYAEVIAS